MNFRFLFIFLPFFLIALPTGAQDIDIDAQYAIVMDADTGMVLYEKNSSTQMYPASMSKMMTAYLVFEQLKDGRLNLNDTLRVSEKAWRKGGSKMFIKVGDEVKVSDLIRGIIVQSGNDACIAIAEGLYGSEEAFVDRMNAKAKELGMNNTHFMNSTGWPDPDHVTTVHDLAILGRALIQNFPEYYKIYSEEVFTYNGIRQSNRNPLLGRLDGVDGIKTGHTEEAGYGLTASALQNGQRLILVAAGMTSEKARAMETEKLMRWAFREFSTETLFTSGEKVGSTSVWLGEEESVDLVLREDALISIPRRERRNIKMKYVTKAPIPAPVSEGLEAGSLIVSIPGKDDVRYPLYTKTAVAKLSGLDKVGRVLSFLMGGEADGVTAQ